MIRGLLDLMSVASAVMILLFAVNNTHLMAVFQNYLGKPLLEGQTILDFTEAEMMGWQWHQPYLMQVISTSLQTEPCQHLITRFFTCWMLFLLPNQHHQSTEGMLICLTCSQFNKNHFKSSYSESMTLCLLIP